MNPFYFSIASIVDANTGYLGDRNPHTLALGSGQARARRIRAQSLLAFLRQLKTALSARFASARAAAEDRRQLQALKHLDDRQLRDIGLHRGDLVAVELGLIELQDLAAERREKNRRIVAVAEPLATAAHGARGVAANDSDLPDSRCA